MSNKKTLFHLVFTHPGRLAHFLYLPGMRHDSICPCAVRGIIPRSHEREYSGFPDETLEHTAEQKLHIAANFGFIDIPARKGYIPVFLREHTADQRA